MSTSRFLPSHTERVIAGARIILGASGLFAVWLDPAEPARFVAATYALHAAYVVYSLVIAAVVWNRSTAGTLPFVTHLIDITSFSVFQYLTLGPSSPFFTYFVFSLFCGALRWGWQGTLGTSVVVVAAYVTMGVSMSRTLGPTEFELNRFIIRAVYLCLTAALLVYLGQHEIRLRTELTQLAHWPAISGLDEEAALSRVLQHAAGTVDARRAVVTWEHAGERWVSRASWSNAGIVILQDSGEEIACVASAPFRTERVAGQVYFSEMLGATAETTVLTEAVARAVGESLDQLRITRQLRDIGAREQRIGLARDLHDGVLQSLTGIRFELQAVARTLADNTTDAGRDRLLAIERALAIEQRELRLFIDELKPQESGGGDSALAERLQALRERVVLEWKVPVTIRVTPVPFALSAALHQAVPLMAHEAIVNAAKHAQPTRIAVDVQVDGGTLRLTVSDDGSGFAFRGRYAHQALIDLNLGPASLRERAASLGGEMSIESTATGSKVEIAVPL